MNSPVVLDVKKQGKVGKLNLHIMFIVYIAILVVGFIFHENFSDEAQAWLIARDLSFAGIISQMKYEGHFLLWYFLLAPLAKAGVSFKVVNVISLIFMAVSGGLIIYKSPFSSLQKCIVLGTAPMLYAFPVIAIRYSMAPLLLFAIASVYKDKLNKPIRYAVLLVVFSNVHILLWGILAALCLDFFIEIVNELSKNRKPTKGYVISLSILVVGILASLLPMVGSVSTNQSVNTPSSSGLLSRWFTMILEHLRWCFMASSRDYLLIIVGVLSLVILVYGVIYYLRETLIFAAGFAFQTMVLAVLYHTVWQKSLFIIVDLIFVLWLVALKKENDSSFSKKRLIFLWCSRFALVIILILSVGDGILALSDDIRLNYSSGKEVSEFISENIEGEAVVVTMEEPATMVSICGYMPADSDVKFYDLRHSRYFTYMIWDGNANAYLEPRLPQLIDDSFTPETNLYYIQLINYSSEYETIYEISHNYIEEGYFTPIFISSDNLSQESFIIYKINR